MKFVSSLAFLAIIVLSSHQAVGDGLGKRVRGVSGSTTSETQHTTDDHSDLHVNRRKIKGSDDGTINLGGSLKGDPCKSQVTYNEAMAKLIGQCVAAQAVYKALKATFDGLVNDRCATTYPYGVNLPIPTGVTAPVSGTFGVSIKNQINSYCDALYAADAAALSLSKTLQSYASDAQKAVVQEGIIDQKMDELVLACPTLTPLTTSGCVPDASPTTWTACVI